MDIMKWIDIRFHYLDGLKQHEMAMHFISFNTLSFFHKFGGMKVDLLS